MRRKAQTRNLLNHLRERMNGFSDVQIAHQSSMLSHRPGMTANPN
jgi:hypothetical protein